VRSALFKAIPPQAPAQIVFLAVSPWVT